MSNNSNSKKEKSNTKIMIIVTVVVIVALVGLCFLVGKDDNEGSSTNTNLSESTDTIMANLQSESAAVKEEDKGEFGDNINVDQLLEQYNQEGKYSLVWVARPTCAYCELTTPIIQKIIKDYGIYISYLNTDDFSEDDTSNFIGISDDFSEGFGTPMLLLVGDGKILDMIDGATDTAHYIEFLKGYKFIEE